MRQIKEFIDVRQRSLNSGFCAHCGCPQQDMDHVPSLMFLDRPYPDNMHRVAACKACNRGLSQDEQYLACLLECVLAGSTNWADVKRDKIAKTLRRSPRLAARLEKSKQVMPNGITRFRIESNRIKKVVLKLARAHVSFELGEPKTEKPAAVGFGVLNLLGAREAKAFKSVPIPTLLPEVGSRAMQRFIEDGNGWVIVQPGNYRYLIMTYGNRITVRFVLREYLACEVTW